MPMENKLSRSAMFDWVVFFTSFSLSFVFPGFINLVASPAFPWLILGAIFLYTLGCLAQTSSPGYPGVITCL